jgi:hypothetical protein
VGISPIVFAVKKKVINIVDMFENIWRNKH